MSSDPEVNPKALEQTRQRINRLVEEIAQLSESQLTPVEFYAEYLQRVLSALAAPGGAIWARNAQGSLQVQYQINIEALGLEVNDRAREGHEELLRQLAMQGRPRLVPPRSSAAASGEGPAPANLTSFVLLVAPIVIEKQVAGLLEVWQDANRSPNAQRGFMQFLVNVSEYAALFLRNSRLRTMVGQQNLWTQLEAYSRNIHSSLNPREVAYHVVNEARRLLECDRVSLAIRQGGYTRIEGISGSDVIEKRSSMVQSMRRLCDEVIVWGEKLVYVGREDESLPPNVLRALDNFLAESNSKMLLIVPLRDEREKKGPSRSALLIECFEPNFSVETLQDRIEVINRHAAPAVYNAVEYNRIPLRWLLQPFATLKDHLSGNNFYIAMAVLLALVVTVLALVVVPWELRMDSKGQFLPKQRQIVYSKSTGVIREVSRAHGDSVRVGEQLFAIYDMEVDKKLSTLQRAMQDNDKEIARLKQEIANTKSPDQRRQLAEQLAKVLTERSNAEIEERILTRFANRGLVVAPISGKVVTTEHEKLKGKVVRPGEPLVQVARTDQDWTIELRVPERYVGHIRDALAKKETLEVDILLASHPDTTYKGILDKRDLAGEVSMHNNEATLLAKVQLIDFPRELLDGMPVGSEVRSKVRCGQFPLGYVLFYELWEFIFEHVWV